MATFAIGLIVYEIASQWQSVTQGYMGISGIPPLGIGGYEIVSDRAQLVVLVADRGAVGAGAPRACARRASAARLRAIAGSEEAARALGIDVARYKLIAFLVSAALCGARGLAVRARGRLRQPGSVRPAHGRAGLHHALCRRHRHDRAARCSARVIVSLLPEMLRGLKDYQDIAYGAVLILILIFAPKGLAALSATLVPRERQGGRMTLLVACENVTKRFGGLVAVDAINLDVAGRRRHRRHRPERRRQDHAVQRHLGLPRAERRPHRVRRPDITGAAAAKRSPRAGWCAPSSSCSCSRT